MSPEGIFFLYLPFPYWAAFVLLQYRHDLSRVLHPLTDDGSEWNWWLVLSYLGILKEAPVRPGRMKEALPYAFFLAASTAVSLSWLAGIFQAVWFNLVIVQGISGLVLTAATVRHLGPPPRRPYVDMLAYPRLGSRIRHLRSPTSLRKRNDRK